MHVILSVRTSVHFFLQPTLQIAMTKAFLSRPAPHYLCTQNPALCRPALRLCSHGDTHCIDSSVLRARVRPDETRDVIETDAQRDDADALQLLLTKAAATHTHSLH
jgi:hypothetical protein